MSNNLVLSHGVMVEKDTIVCSDFVKSFSVRQGTNSYFGGTWEELETLVKENFHNQEPGFGSVDGDVVLVNVPVDNFFTSIVPITDENQHLIENVEQVRQEGEKPVTMQIIKGKKIPARYVQIVCYRADTLAQDNDRSSDAEWEIIAVNAQLDEYTPMHPNTMARNANHDEGGTFREYTAAQWADAYSYWEAHAYIEEV